MNRKLVKDSEVYLVLAPNNYIREYRCVKCKVKSMYYRGSTQKDVIEYDDEKPPYDYRITLYNIEDPKSYYCNKHLDKIYFEDDITQMVEDITNLNKILDFKQKQKQELKDYVHNEFPKWKYKGDLNI